MKNSLYVLASVCLALSPCVVRAQSADSTAAVPAASVPAADAAAPTAKADKADKAARKGLMANLTPDEQKKLLAARKAAMQDPSVKAAEAKRAEDPKAYRMVLNAAMIHSDPSVAAILEKQKSERRMNKGDKGAKGVK